MFVQVGNRLRYLRTDPIRAVVRYAVVFPVSKVLTGHCSCRRGSGGQEAVAACSTPVEPQSPRGRPPEYASVNSDVVPVALLSGGLAGHTHGSRQDAGAPVPVAEQVAGNDVEDSNTGAHSWLRYLYVLVEER